MPAGRPSDAREQQADSLADDCQAIADAATPENWTVAQLRVQSPFVFSGT